MIRLKEFWSGNAWIWLAAAIGWSTAGAAVVTFEHGRVPVARIHVATSGDDSTGNGTLALPFRTISRAVNAAEPGTAVVIHAGDYAAGSYWDGISGTEANPIWIGGAAGESKPRILDGSEGIHLSSVRYLVLHDLEITGADANGINCDDGGEVDDPEATRFVVLRGLHVHGIGTGGNNDCLKLSGVRDYYILDSVFENGSGGGSGIDHVGCHRGMIVGNRFANMGSNAIQSKGGSSDIEIRGNWFEDCRDRTLNIGGSTGFEFFRPPLSATSVNYEAIDIRVFSNVFIGSDAPFAFVGALNCIVANNTVVHPHNWFFRILQETLSSGDYAFGACADNEVVNNIFFYDRSDLSSTQINVGSNTAPSTFVIRNNLWFNDPDPSQSGITGMPVSEQNGIYGQDPMFADLIERDYRLLNGSPARSSGVSISALSTDYGDQPWANPPNRGAWEGQYSSNLAPQLNPVGNRTVEAGQPLQIQVNATDEDGTQLDYAASGGG